MLRRRVLDVPYLVQPTSITCQSTCLKMFAKYLAKKTFVSNPGAVKPIQDIWKEINTGTARPAQVRNSYQNMIWWLGKYFVPKRFQVTRLTTVDAAVRKVVHCIDQGYPVMVSTNHSRTSGHIILVIGYATSTGSSPPDTNFICHDPYGKFDPQLFSKTYGKRRYEGGGSLSSGGEMGPGKNVVYDSDGIRRIRKDKHSTDSFFLISAVC